MAHSIFKSVPSGSPYAYLESDDFSTLAGAAQGRLDQGRKVQLAIFKRELPEDLARAVENISPHQLDRLAQLEEVCRHGSLPRIYARLSPDKNASLVPLDAFLKGTLPEPVFAPLIDDILDKTGLILDEFRRGQAEATRRETGNSLEAFVAHDYSNAGALHIDVANIAVNYGAPLLPDGSRVPNTNGTIFHPVESIDPGRPPKALIDSLVLKPGAEGYALKPGEIAFFAGGRNPVVHDRYPLPKPEMTGQPHRSPTFEDAFPSTPPDRRARRLSLFFRL